LIFEVRFRHNQLEKPQFGQIMGAENDFWKFVTKLLYFRHISGKIQLKNLKQHFDGGGGIRPCIRAQE